MYKELKLCTKAVTGSKDKIKTMGKEEEEKERGKEAFREEKHGQCHQQQNLIQCSIHLHILYPFGVDHVPVSHHAAGNSVHGITLL